MRGELQCKYSRSICNLTNSVTSYLHDTRVHYIVFPAAAHVTVQAYSSNHYSGSETLIQILSDFIAVVPTSITTFTTSTAQVNASDLLLERIVLMVTTEPLTGDVRSTRRYQYYSLQQQLTVVLLVHITSYSNPGSCGGLLHVTSITLLTVCQHDLSLRTTSSTSNCQI